MDELDERARSRAAEAGRPSVEAYLRSLLVDDIELGEAAPPPAQHVAELSKLTELVRAGLESGPAVELTDADWERKRQDLIQRHSGRNAS